MAAPARNHRSNNFESEKIMSTRHPHPSSHQPDTGNSSGHGWRCVLGLFALAWAVGAQAVVTVGPHGAFSTIQDGINAAIGNGGDEVRVELKCLTFCPYVENVDFTTFTTINLSGGWAADFQSQISTLASPIVGTGGDAPIMRVSAAGNAIVSISRFALLGPGSGGTPGFATRGLIAGATDNAVMILSDNTIRDNELQISSSSTVAAGAGVAVYAGNAALVDVVGNTIQSNQIIGTDSRGVFGGGVYLLTDGAGHIDFILNHLVANIASNANGGGCHGGGLEAESHDQSSMQLRGNLYEGNEQLFCTNGATGDAVDIEATNTMAGTGIELYEEIWSGNSVPNDPGVYQVFIGAHNAAQIRGANGLVTNGTWGGVFAGSDASATISLSNYTVTAHPTIGVTASGSGTQIWNTLMWNNGADEDPRNGATFANSLGGIDPLFVDAANGNYHLSPGSPAIDTASNTPTGGLRAFDLDGSPRPFNGTADIGAYEYQGDPNDLIFRNGFD